MHPESAPRPASEHRRRWPALALSLATLGTAASAQQPGDAITTDALAQRLHAIEQRLGIAGDTSTLDLAALDHRLRALERSLAERDSLAPTPPPAPTQPTLTLASDKAVTASSADGKVQLKLGAVLQADHRSFIDDDQRPQNDSFLWRRIRPTLEGSWGDLVGFRITPELAGDSASLIDAYIDLKFNPAATLRIGKVKGPIGLERLQGAAALALIERGFPTELAPNRDLGLQLQGNLAARKLTYVLGIYNGAPDGRDSPGSNPDAHHELAGRVFLEPWQGSGSALAGLGFGIAASSGDKQGGGNAFLPRYRTPGQATFFNYRSTVLADGAHTRWSPQAYWHHGPVGVLGEYISSRQTLTDTASGTHAALDHRAWQLLARWVLTGEKAGYRGLTPDRPFSPGSGGTGAFELVARYGRLDIDDAAFPLFADASVSASAATSWGLGLNWYPSRNLKLIANYTQAGFDGGGGTGSDREAKKTLFTRAQFSF